MIIQKEGKIALGKFKAKIGIASFMAYPNIGSGKGPVVESIKKIVSDPFFSLIEIAHIEDEDIREEVKKILISSNIKVSFGAHPAIFGDKLNINSADEKIRDESVGSLEKLIDETYQMNSESYVFVSGPLSIEASPASQLELLKLSINRLCTYNLKTAREYGKDQLI